MSPTVFRQGGFRFYFFSREEERPHVHVHHATGEANRFTEFGTLATGADGSPIGTDGLNVPGVSTLDGAPMGGWIQYSFGPTVSAWLAQHFDLHWRYSRDRAFLEERAYPWVRDVAVHLEQTAAVSSLVKLAVGGCE